VKREEEVEEQVGMVVVEAGLGSFDKKIRIREDSQCLFPITGEGLKHQ